MRASIASIVAGLVLLSCLSAGCAQHPLHDQGIPATASTPSITLTDQVVDAGCAKCMFGMNELEDCQTAIRVNGVIYFATGKDVPDAEDHGTGVCHAILKARVSGKTVGDTFVASSFVMLP